MFRHLGNLLYTPACSRCQRRLHTASAVFCPSCEAGMPRRRRPLCARCGVGLPGAFDARLFCASCRERPPAFEEAHAPWEYTGVARDAIRLFKYHGRRRIGTWLAREMAVCGSQTLPLARVDLVLPIPSHWLTRRLRDVHPAAELARQVANALRKPYASCNLRRRRWTATQTAKSWQARWRNVRGAFVATTTSLRGRTVLLIDDVLTSGATAHACALALKDAGVRQVFVLTAARTPLTHLDSGTRGLPPPS